MSVGGSVENLSPASLIQTVVKSVQQTFHLKFYFQIVEQRKTDRKLDVFLCLSNVGGKE